MQTKHTQKVDHFTVFESFPSTSCCSQKFMPKKIENLAGWKCETVSGMFTLGGWQGMDWWEKVIVKNCGRVLMKPRNQPEEVVWLVNG